MFDLPSPHGDKLNALLKNSNLPIGDRPQVEQTLTRYQQWLSEMDDVEGSSDLTVAKLVDLLNTYKLYVDVSLIFDSESDFLYRQKGQLKLDNSIIEEFIPRLVTTVLRADFEGLNLKFGPTKSFSALRFEEGIASVRRGADMMIRSKDQDFAISRKLFIRASHEPDFSDAVTSEANIAYVASEIKTNLDKTMYQEAAATALDIKTVVPGAKYFLLCEWLDMTPISTSATAIDEILILRRAKRLASNVRSSFATSAGRKQTREAYVDYLTKNPLFTAPFSRFLSHIRSLVSEDSEEEVLGRGYF